MHVAAITPSDATSFEVETDFAAADPRVARSSQPWAGGRNPFGIGKAKVQTLLEYPTALFNPFPLTPTLSPRRGRIVVLFGTIRRVPIFRRAGQWRSLSLGRWVRGGGPAVRK